MASGAIVEAIDVVGHIVQREPSVVAGQGNAAVSARHLFLEREEYLQLLKSASVAITDGVP